MSRYEFMGELFPDAPGVYLMKDGSGSILYIGKAKSLRNRVSSYFAASVPSRISALTSSIEDIETIATNNEQEALLLENELIKRHKPPFNTRLKDDKSFPYIMVSSSEEFPRVAIIRGPHLYDAGNMFFGPYVNKKAVRKILKMLRVIFPFCNCRSPVQGKPAKPCLYYHLGQCPAPCAFKEEAGFKRRYMKGIDRVISFLQGNHERLLQELKDEMARAASKQEYEAAAAARDKIKALENMFKPQAVIMDENIDMDVVSMADDGEELVVIVLEIRGGILVGKIPFVFNLQGNASDHPDILASFLVEHYTRERARYPATIFVVGVPGDSEGASLAAVGAVISEASGGKVESVTTTPRLDSDLLEQLEALGHKNSMQVLHERMLNRDMAAFSTEEAIDELSDILGLDTLAFVIEGYDISTLQGSAATGSKVVFKNGKPWKSGYRRYKIRSVTGQDDYAMMAEVLDRRLAKIVAGRDKPPNLMVIDGGRGQLNVAIGALEKHGLAGTIPVIGLAKQREELYLPGVEEPLSLPDNSKARLLLQRVRDESHRFAVKYHHVLRDKQLDEMGQELMEIKSIGEKRAKLLRSHFKTMDEIVASSTERLESVLGSRAAAEEVIKHFSRGGKKKRFVLKKQPGID